jgi:hypothetical protein
MLPEVRDPSDGVVPAKRGDRLLQIQPAVHQRELTSRQSRETERTCARLSDLLTMPVACDLTCSTVFWEDCAWDMMIEKKMGGCGHSGTSRLEETQGLRAMTA